MGRSFCRARSRALAAAAAAAIGALAVGACGVSDPAPQALRTHVTERPPSWFEHITDVARVSPDGRWALYGTGARLGLVDLETGAGDDRLTGPFTAIDAATFMPDGRLVRRTTTDGALRWYVDGDSTPLPLPGHRWPIWSPDGKRLASFDMNARSAGVRVDDRDYPVPGHLLSVGVDARRAVGRHPHPDAGVHGLPGTAGHRVRAARGRPRGPRRRRLSRAVRRRRH